jgi:integral membrane protein (TIGR01906 family)
VRGGLVAAATALVILGVAILPFTTPAYVHAEQDRAGVPALTGYDRETLDVVTGALLGDVFLWRGGFDVAVDGAAVLTERERSHMRDVRGVFAGVVLLILVAAAWLAIEARRTRADAWARAGLWRSAGRGATALAIVVVVLGVVSVIAFEAVFELFHRLFFTSGSYTFDPARDRLVQLFPQQFWSETTMLLGIGLVTLSALVAWIAARRNRANRRRVPVTAASPAGAT